MVQKSQAEFEELGYTLKHQVLKASGDLPMLKSGFGNYAKLWWD